jgi:glycosyltransferase involved in cell wall biosynthesis
MVLKRAGGYGGMQQQAGRVCVQLRKRGLAVGLLTARQADGVAPVWWTGRLNTHFLAASSQWGFAREVYRHLCLRRDEYDVVHVHGFGPETFAAIAAKRVTGKALVVKPSTAGKGTKLHAYARWSAVAPPLRTAWRGVDAWASISSETGADLLRMGVPPGRILRIPNGVDRSVFHPLPPAERQALRAELGLAEGELLVCTAARLAPHKRVDLLIRAFLSLAERFPQARLWVAGYGEQERELQELVSAAGAAERVRLLGRTQGDALCRIMQAADVFALLSLWEGLSNALLEAMSCALPPVVSNVSGMADVVRDGVSGLVVPPDNEAASRDALAELLGNAIWRRELGLAAERTVVEHYGLEQTVERLIQLYQALLGRGEIEAARSGVAPQSAGGKAQRAGSEARTKPGTEVKNRPRLNPEP